MRFQNPRRQGGAPLGQPNLLHLLFLAALPKPGPLCSETPLCSKTECVITCEAGTLGAIFDRHSSKRLAVVKLEGFILVGGESSRMGTDKSRLLLGNQTFVERIAGALSAITDSIFLVGGRTEGPPGKLVSIPDIRPMWGALGGLHAALSACHTQWAAVVACDLPFVSGDFFLRLASYASESEAVVPMQKDNRPQPLCALYRIDPCLAFAEKLIAWGERRPRVLLQSVQTRWISFERLADLPGSEQFFDNINTPEDYRRAKEKRETTRVAEMN